MKLVIVESPTKSLTIGKYLGPGYKVIASEGHIRDLSTRGKGGLGIDIENGFKPNWEISDRKKGLVAKLSAEAAKADEVLLATDPDREGEAISYHLAQVLHLPVKTTKRLQFHEITKPAILAAMEHPGTIDEKLVRAQETRRMEDRIIGFRVSSLLQRKINLQSAGRVQSSTLRMIVDRKNAIDSFVPVEYWTIEAELTIDGKKYKAPLTRVDGKPFKCSNREEAEAILARIPKELTVSSISKQERKTLPGLPFKTSTLQQDAYAKFHFSNAKTQSVAQKLYEGLTVNGEHVGLITYMRTDSTSISPDFYNRHFVPFVLERYGKEYLGGVRKGKDSKNAQLAHEAIRPTGTHRTPEEVAKYVSPDEAKLYRLIYCRAMASMMAPKISEGTTVILSGNGLDFTLTGSRVLFKGYAIIYGDFEDSEEGTLPPINEGDSYAVDKIDDEQKFTKPEPPYNAASIVRAMEEKGIGRPSTYASTVDTLVKRKYITTTKGAITPTEEGIKAVEVLGEYFPDVVSTDYTAAMEAQLDKVESGEKTLQQAMEDFYVPFNEKYERAKERMEKEPPEETGELCPVCGSPLVIRKSRRGQPFVGCSAFPKCDYIKKEEKEPDEPTGELCPDCGKPLVYKKSKKGEKFIACTGYPTCRYTQNVGAPATPKAPRKEVKPEDIVKPCPKCKKGYLVIKHGKKTDFLGCTNYPRCKYHEWLNAKKEEK